LKPNLVAAINEMISKHDIRTVMDETVLEIQDEQIYEGNAITRLRKTYGRSAVARKNAWNIMASNVKFVAGILSKFTAMILPQLLIFTTLSQSIMEGSFIRLFPKKIYYHSVLTAMRPYIAKIHLSIQMN
jgi:hypothetical protein